MSTKDVKSVLDHYFEILGKTEHQGSEYLLVKYHNTRAHRLLSIITTREIDAQLGTSHGSLKAFLSQANDASTEDFFTTLQSIFRSAEFVDPTRKAISAYNLLNRLYDLQNEKAEKISSQRRTEISNNYNDVARRLHAVDAEPE